jgi:hypothetical protein
MVLRIEHLLVSGAWAGFSSASSRPAQPSPLYTSAHLRSPTSSHPAVIQRDGAGLRGERAHGHDSCSSDSVEMLLTWHFNSIAVVPICHDAAAPFAVRAQEIANDDGDDFPGLDPSCNGVPPSARPFPPEASTPRTRMLYELSHFLMEIWIVTYRRGRNGLNTSEMGYERIFG